MGHTGGVRKVAVRLVVAAACLSLVALSGPQVARANERDPAVRSNGAAASARNASRRSGSRRNATGDDQGNGVLGGLGTTRWAGTRSCPTISRRTASAPQPPLLVAAGASFTYGVGATSSTDTWPCLLGKILGWRVVVEGVPGAGYVRRGIGDGGPLGREVARLHLRRLHPALVILQAGHNDVGVSRSLLRRRVTSVVETVRREDHLARIALVTVFAAWPPTPADLATDRTIIDTARRIDPSAIVMDPLGGHWHFATIADHLHPTDAGHLWIACRIARRLLAGHVSIWPANGSALSTTTASTLPRPCPRRSRPISVAARHSPPRASVTASVGPLDPTITASHRASRATYRSTGVLPTPIPFSTLMSQNR
jgi:lysophospholipase L1-like esterase